MGDGVHFCTLESVEMGRSMTKSGACFALGKQSLRVSSWLRSSVLESLLRLSACSKEAKPRITFIGNLNH
ncbi:unnamed protein product [Schistosoma margrebowiei]|uniref:Uncharacterized protein n=1 Tax=Schistosoma margrebowiei TaxID=48269 RepID=A0A3P8FXY8_9TREM|nr:unnamed protein product [Schistosoma margrebowiei]